jgi:hypothetical protein
MSLARKSGTSYHRLITGAALTDSELCAIEAVLGPLEAEHELSAAADQVIRTVFATPTPAASPEITPQVEE